MAAALAIHAGGGVPLDGEQAGQAGNAESDSLRADVVAEGSFKEQADDQKTGHDGECRHFEGFAAGERHEGSIGVDGRRNCGRLRAQRQQDQHQRIARKLQIALQRWRHFQFAFQEQRANFAAEFLHGTIRAEPAAEEVAGE